MSEQIRADFDRLALLDSDGWTHNNHYHPFLLKHMPVHCDNALEIGCGAGAFSRELAKRSRHVLGLDLAPEMVRLARERSINCPNVDYQVVDVLKWEFPPSKYDCIASLATFHHLPLAEILQKAKAALRPGGVLLILDLFKSAFPQDFLIDTAAIPVSIFLRLIKTGRLREPQVIREAWKTHGIHDVYLPLAEIRQSCTRILPGAEVRRHLFWRYSLVWKKV